MALSSAAYLFCFLPIGTAAYFLIPNLRGKNIFLIIFGLIFYAFGQIEGVILLLLSSAVNYAAGVLIARGWREKTVFIVDVVFDLLMLGVFKYFDFFVGGVAGLFGVKDFSAGLILPVGISFFTFREISYVADCRKNPQAASRSFFDVLLYISFFPQLTSGPIARFGDFERQLRERTHSAERAARGLRRLIVGLAKKLLVASLVGEIADAAFTAGALDFRLAWLGAAAYTLQIYFDFSGYSDMAIGLASVFGFDSPENFNYPYVSSSITEFWRRWHISLSSWFRDYVYIPLGGSRRGVNRTAANKAAVFLLCGLWHGASMTFVLWGAWHAAFSALESRFKYVDRLRSSKWGRGLSHVYALAAVCLGFVLFRADTLAQAGTVYAALFTGFSLSAETTLALQRITPTAWIAFAAGIAACTPLYPLAAKKLTNERAREVLSVASWPCSVLLLALCMLALAGGGFQPFIYFQF
ncbi:MAG: MBOAT family protein [Oscillospiraceae bacterium]|nr:MBOAT family protein [Oscillospiraceae bacterium]